MPAEPPAIEIEVDDKVVRVSNPDRVYFPESGATKRDLVEHDLAVGDGIVNALYERPCMLHRRSCRIGAPDRMVQTPLERALAQESRRVVPKRLGKCVT